MLTDKGDAKRGIAAADAFHAAWKRIAGECTRGRGAVSDLSCIEICELYVLPAEEIYDRNKRDSSSSTFVPRGPRLRAGAVVPKKSAASDTPPEEPPPIGQVDASRSRSGSGGDEGGDG